MPEWKKKFYWTAPICAQRTLLVGEGPYKHQILQKYFGFGKFLFVCIFRLLRGQGGRAVEVQPQSKKGQRCFNC